MKKFFPLCLIVFIFSCCARTSSNYDTGDTLTDEEILEVYTDSDSEDEETDAVAEVAEPECLRGSLEPFKCVVDTLGQGSTESPKPRYDYFLYDITGDGNPELWLVYGTCEADKELRVYSADNGKVRKIFIDDAGHTEYFLNGNKLGFAACQSGYGAVGIYHCKRGKISVDSAEFSMWNEDGEARATNKKKQWIIDFWNSSTYDIPLSL